MQSPLFCFLILVVVSVNTDDYLNEIQGRCYTMKKSFSCAKYELFKYIDDMEWNNVSLTSDSSVKFIRMSSSVNGSDEIDYFQQPRQYENHDSEMLKIWKFFKRRIAKFVHGQGLSVELPEGAEVVIEQKETGRGKKEKKQIILPILILLKLFKLKILTSLVLLGVLFIKKILLLAAFILPGVVAAIKAHCKAQTQYHVVPHQIDEEHHIHHDHDDDDGWVYGGDKHFWDKKRYSYY